MGRGSRQGATALRGSSDGSRHSRAETSIVPLKYPQSSTNPLAIPTDSDYHSRLTEEILYWQEGEMRNWDEDGLCADGNQSGIFLEAKNGPAAQGPLFRCHSPLEDLEGIHSWSEGLETPLSFALGRVLIEDENGNKRVESLQRRSRPTGDGENYAPDDIIDFSFLEEGQTATIYFLRASGVEHGIDLGSRLEEVRGAWIAKHLQNLQADIRSQEEAILLENESYNSKDVRHKIVALLENQMTQSELQDLGVSADMPTDRLYFLVKKIGGEPLRIWNEHEQRCTKDASQWLDMWSSDNVWGHEKEIIASSDGVRDAQGVTIKFSGGSMPFSELVSLAKRAVSPVKNL